MEHGSIDWPPGPYEIEGVERVLTPALAIYPEIVDHNIDALLRLVGGDASRVRPHVKTSKLAHTMRRLLDHGIGQFKCATTLELRALCELGAPDVLVAYPVVGAGARRVRELQQRFPATRVSALVDASVQLDAWRAGGVGLFVDVNPGMDRTGVADDRGAAIVALASAIVDAGLVFRGLHFYDGHLTGADLPRREREAHRGYDRLMRLVRRLGRAGLPVDEIVTAGTPALPCSLSYAQFAEAPPLHRVSPGTVVYGDCTSAAQLPAEYGYRPAALVLATVVSQPAPGIVTCNAGHKTVSADAGVPTCRVLGRPGLTPLAPSEEHLPLRVADGTDRPPIGTTLYLVPRHVCPTVNNFDQALIVSGRRVRAVESVTARGREAPLGRPGTSERDDAAGPRAGGTGADDHA